MQFISENECLKLAIRIPVQYAEKARLREAKNVACMTDSIGRGDFSSFRALVVDDEVIELINLYLALNKEKRKLILDTSKWLAKD